LSPTISETRNNEGGYGAFYVDTRSLCSRTRSTLVKGTGELRSGSLQKSLNCLVQAIEQLSYSCKTFNTSFSWILDLSMSLYAERNIESESSTEKVEEIIEAPMIILDDLRICEQRAKTILERGATTGLPGMLDGREKHKMRNLNRIKAMITTLLGRKGFKILNSEVEGPPLLFSTRTRKKRILLRGRPDIVLLVETPCRQLAAMNIEYATYTSASKTIIYRQTMYAHSLYNLYGFPVTPVLLIDASKTKGAYVLFKANERTIEFQLRAMLAKLAKLVEGIPARPARTKEVCYTCPLPIRSICPYWEG